MFKRIKRGIEKQLVEETFDRAYGLIERDKIFAAASMLERAVQMADKYGHIDSDDLKEKVVEASRRYEALGNSYFHEQDITKLRKTLLHRSKDLVPDDFNEDEQVMAPFKSLAQMLFSYYYPEYKVGTRMFMNSLLIGDTSPEFIYDERVRYFREILTDLRDQKLVENPEFDTLDSQLEKVLMLNSSITTTAIRGLEEAQEVGHKGASYVPEWDETEH